VDRRLLIKSVFKQMRLYNPSIPGVIICPPVREPGPTDILLGYEIVDDHTDTCLGGAFHLSPKPSKMNQQGWLCTAALLLLCFPFGCVPCFMTCAYDTRVQRPVYRVCE
jgi:hypothetical protein